MFMIARIQSTVSGAPSHSGSAWTPMNGNVKRSIQTPKITGIVAARIWPPSFCHQSRPRKSSIAPTAWRRRAPISRPRIGARQVEERERRHEDPDEQREPAEPRDRELVDAARVGLVDGRRVARARSRRPPG